LGLASSQRGFQNQARRKFMRPRRRRPHWPSPKKEAAFRRPSSLGRKRPRRAYAGETNRPAPQQPNCAMHEMQELLCRRSRKCVVILDHRARAAIMRPQPSQAPRPRGDGFPLRRRPEPRRPQPSAGASERQRWRRRASGAGLDQVGMLIVTAVPDSQPWITRRSMDPRVTAGEYDSF